MARCSAWRWWAICILLSMMGGMGCGGQTDDDAAIEVSPPDSVLSREAYKAVLAEALLIEAADKQRVFRNDNDSARIADAFGALFARHDIDAAAYERSQKWWFGHPEALIPLLQEVTEDLSAQERAYDAPPPPGAVER